MMVDGKEIAQNEDRAMNIVIAAANANVSRTFYAGTYQEGQSTAPSCWSNDGITPDINVEAPEASKCASCAQNIKGSGQGDGRACRFSQRIAVVLDNDIGGDVFQLVLPSTSIFGEGEAGKWPLQMYAKMIGAKGVPITAVVTEMRFDTASSTPKITFKPVRFLESNEISTAIDQGKSTEAIKAITMTVAKAKDDAPALEAPKVESKAKPADEAEPTKRTAKKEEPTAKKDLSKILSDWDDEE
jgi:hypothetical protein